MAMAGISVLALINRGVALYTTSLIRKATILPGGTSSCLVLTIRKVLPVARRASPSCVVDTSPFSHRLVSSLFLYYLHPIMHSSSVMLNINCRNADPNTWTTAFGAEIWTPSVCSPRDGKYVASFTSPCFPTPSTLTCWTGIVYHHAH